MFSVGQLQAETMGRPGLLGLCIGRRQKRDVRSVLTTRFLAEDAIMSYRGFLFLLILLEENGAE